MSVAALAVATGGIFGLAAPGLAAGGVAFASSGCDSWVNPSGGSWNVATNWSTRSVPGSLDNACITMAGNYTVTIARGIAGASSLTLGSAGGNTTQVLLVEGIPDPKSRQPDDAGVSVPNGGTINSTGELVLDSQAGGGSAYWTSNSGVKPLVNDGSIVTQVEGGPRSVSGVAVNLDAFRANLVNNGTVTVRSGELLMDSGYTTTNEGTFTTGPAAVPGLEVSAENASFVNDRTVTNDGDITSGGIWSQNGGRVTGHAVIITGSLEDAGAASSIGRFDLLGDVDVSGTIAAGETVNVQAVAGRGAIAVVSSGLTNKGTVVLDSQAGGGVATLTANSSREPLVNDGSIVTQVEGTKYDALEANLVNNGTVTLRSGELLQDGNTTTTNDGDIILEVPGRFDLTSGNDVFNQEPHGTLTFDISGASRFGRLNVSGGATLNLTGGTASPVLLGGFAPAVGASFDVITGPHEAGRFTTVSNGFRGDYSDPAFVALVRG
jgi:hypothetical protein